VIGGFDFLSVMSDIAHWANQRLADGGPRYAEYHPELIVVEPWNAISSVFMMFPAFFWLYKMRKSKLSDHKMLFFAIAMVFLGGLGSTLFHAFRMSPIFLMMDVLPSALLTLSLAVYFWLKILPKWWYVLFIFVPVFSLRFLLFSIFTGHLGINISYAISGLLIIVPLLIILYQTSFNNGFWFLAAFLAFGFALMFRQLDVHSFHFLPQGTHFLWHFFSAIGSFCMLGYLVLIDGFSQKQKKAA